MYITVTTSDRLTYQQARHVSEWFLLGAYTPQEILGFQEAESTMPPMVQDALADYRQRLIDELCTTADLLSEAERRIETYSLASISHH